MARLFSKDYHERSTSWYFNHAIIALEAGNLEFWHSVDEKGNYHIRFFPVEAMRSHFPDRLDVIFDPKSERVLEHDCPECGASEDCRHYLSVLRYAYQHLNTDDFDVPAVETLVRHDLRASDNWSKSLREAKLDLEGLYDPKGDKVRLYYNDFAFLNINQLINQLKKDPEKPHQDMDLYALNREALSLPKIQLLLWLSKNRAAQSTVNKFFSVDKVLLPELMQYLARCEDFVRIRESGDLLVFHTKPYPMSLRIERAGKSNFVVKPVIVEELSTYVVGFPLWLFFRNEVYQVHLPLADDVIAKLMQHNLIIAQKDLVYYRTVVHQELKKQGIYLDFDPDIALPQILDDDPKIRLELKRLGDMYLIEGTLKYPTGHTIPLFVTRFNSSLVRCDYDLDGMSGNAWFYLPPRVFAAVEKLLELFPDADRNRVQQYSQISFSGEDVLARLRERVFAMGDEDWELIIADDLGHLFVQKVPLRVVIEARQGEQQDWFSYTVSYSYQDLSFTHEELRKFFKSEEEFLHTEDGRLIFISNPSVYEETQRLIERSEAHKDGVYSARLNELPYYQKLMRQNPAIRLMQDEWLNQLSIDLQRRHLGQPAVLPSNLQNILRGYQKAGVAWLQMLRHYGLNGILADEMGLGKTIQALSVLQGTPDGRISLLICPKTLLYNWVAEIDKFHTNIPHLVVEGDKLTREELLSQPNVKLLLISYSLVLNDLELLKDFNFYYIVLDEAQNIKNTSAQRTAAIKKLKSENRLALSGTPMENRLTELWSQFDFLMPGYLRSLKSFKDTYEKAEDQELAQQRLQRMVAPFILRRIKKEVLLELPDKQEQISWCKLGTVQEKAYLQVLENVKKQLFPAESSGAISYMHILSALTKLRQICNHPHLINPDIKPEPAASSKLEQLLHLLEESLEGGHKVLVFSQFVQMLTIIRRAIEDSGWDYCYLDGRTKNRMQVVNEFEHNPDKRIFLISLKAGGTGLNLTVADTVILFDPWWNPMVENQAIDRAHRIGQTNKVQVVRLISKGTVEEKIVALQQSKLAMFENIVSGDRQVLSSLSTEDIKALFEY